jgi:dTDP-4-dehydrorhamnose reductase
MQLLITGASGLLGLNLAVTAARKHEVYGVVNRHLLKATDFAVVATDLLQPEAAGSIIKTVQPDWIVNCVAQTDLEVCEKDPQQAQQINTRLPEILAHATRAADIRFLHISTDAVFDGTQDRYKETDQPTPISVYARTKLDGEQAVMAANPDALIARVNFYGWSLTGKRSLAEWFINNLRQGKQINGFTDVHFCPLLVNDLANLLLKMMELGLSGLYHVVGADCISKYDFGLALANRFGLDQTLIRPASVKDSGLMAKRSSNMRLDTTRLAEALGYPPSGLAEGVNQFYQLEQQGYAKKLRSMAAG